jgi:hypothetical protein
LLLGPRDRDETEAARRILLASYAYGYACGRAHE